MMQGEGIFAKIIYCPLAFGEPRDEACIEPTYRARWALSCGGKHDKGFEEQMEQYIGTNEVEQPDQVRIEYFSPTWGAG